jgi:transposase InsO family protein
VAAIGFLRRAVAWFAERGIVVKRVMTDNGPAYVSHAHAAACRRLGLRHLRTRPYRPRTNGKAERFIQTLYESGPTAASTAAQPSGPRSCHAGPSTTTSNDHTAPSATNHQAHD